MEPLNYLLGTSSLPLDFQKQMYHIIWIWKNIQKISPKILLVFLRFKMNLAMKTILLKYIFILEFPPNNIGGLKYIYAKKSYIFTYFEIYFSNCQKLKI
jgi:hypothetical protein